MGTGSVRGFAQTLAIGVLLSMFTALAVTRFVINTLFYAGCDKIGMYGIQKPVKIYDFIKNRTKFFLISAVVIVIGLVSLVVFQARTGSALNYGLDFLGGSSTSVTFPSELTDSVNTDMERLIEDTVGSGAGTEIVRVQGENTVLIKTRELSVDELKAVQDKLLAEYNVTPENIQVENISGVISSEMRRNAVLSLVIANLCMLLYIFIRFKNIGSAGSAVLALLHDVLCTLALYALVRISVGNNFITCMLTLVGFSINATIVVFDRIRENLKSRHKNETYRDVVNKSISQTIVRSINTSITVALMVLMLCILGVDSVREFSIPFLFGTIMGTWSSVLLSGNMWYFYMQKVQKLT
jgi:SecD/SecF fusion protein